jgi:hypothetical protein
MDRGGEAFPVRMHARWRWPVASVPRRAVVRIRGRVKIELLLRPSGLGAEADGRIGAEVVAWAVLSRIPDALAYRVSLDPGGGAARPTRRWRLHFVPPQDSGAAHGARVQTRGELYYVALDTRRTWADDFAPEWEALRTQYDGISISAVVTVPER